MDVPLVWEDIFGWLGGLVSLCYNVPQIYRNQRTRSVRDLSECSLVLRMVSYILYIIHVWIKKDAAIFYMYIFSFLQLIILLFQFRLYKQSDGRPNGQARVIPQSFPQS
jgi:uncharacterized protein with PQ loop repeat